MVTICHICRELVDLLAMGKFEGPTHCLMFLGIEMHTQVSVLRLNQEKAWVHQDGSQKMAA